MSTAASSLKEEKARADDREALLKETLLRERDKENRYIDHVRPHSAHSSTFTFSPSEYKYAVPGSLFDPRRLLCDAQLGEKENCCNWVAIPGAQEFHWLFALGGSRSIIRCLTFSLKGLRGMVKYSPTRLFLRGHLYRFNIKSPCYHGGGETLT